MKKNILFVLALFPMMLFADNYDFLKPSDELPTTIWHIIVATYVALFGYFAFLTLHFLKIQQKKELTYQRRATALLSGFFFSNLVAVAFTILFLGESNDIFLVSKLLLSESSVFILFFVLSAIVLAYPNQIVHFCMKNRV